MFKKIKNKGIIYTPKDNNDIMFNNIFVEIYLKNTDKDIKTINNITKTIYYEKIKCKY